MLWTDQIEVGVGDALALIGTVTDRIVDTTAHLVTVAERGRVRSAPERSLDALQAYHRGLDALSQLFQTGCAQA